MENWNFSSSVYFWFISLTTIGYGDLHFDRDKHLNSIHFLLISAGLLLFGLGMVAAVIESFALVMEKTSQDTEDDESDTVSYVDFEDHERVTSLVLSTVNCGAGVIMESQRCGEDPDDDNESRGRKSTITQDILESSFNGGPSTSRRGKSFKGSLKRSSSINTAPDTTQRERPFSRRVSFMDQTMRIHNFSQSTISNPSYLDFEEEDLTGLDEINA